MNYIVVLITIFFSSFVVFSQDDIDFNDYVSDSIMFNYLESEEYDKAEDQAFRIIQAKKESRVDLFLINAHTVLGIINKKRGYYLSATENYLEALNKSIEIKDSARISSILNNIGTIHYFQDNYSSAIEYYKKSLRIELKLNNAIQRSIRYYNIADCYRSMDSTEMALYYYSNSLLLEKKENNQEGIYYAKLGLAEIYLKINELNQVDKILTELNQHFLELNSELKVLFLILKIKLFQINNNHPKAIEYIDEAITLTNSFNLKSQKRDLIKLKIKSVTSLGKYKEAVNLYELYYTINQELINTEIVQKTADLNYNNELNLKKQELRYLKDQNELLNEKQQYITKVAKYEIQLLILSILLIILVIIFGVYILKKNKLNEDFR